MWNRMQWFHMTHTDLILTSLESHVQEEQWYLMDLMGKCFKAGDGTRTWATDGTGTLQHPESTTNSNIKIHHRANSGRLAMQVLLQGRGLVMTMMMFSPDSCQQEMTWAHYGQKQVWLWVFGPVCREKNHRRHRIRKFLQPTNWWLPSI